MRFEKAAVVVLGLCLPGCTSRPPMPARPATSPAPAAQAQPASGRSPASDPAPAASPAAPTPPVTSSPAANAPTSTAPVAGGALADSSMNMTPGVASARESTPTGDVFVDQVRPLLARTCTPCHVPGGRMYDRLPFDDPGTVRRAKDGILRRLKVPEERALVEAWLASQPKD